MPEHDRPPVFRLRDLTISRPGVRIIDDLNWTFLPDQNWALLGPNGAGKSSIIQVLNAWLPPSSGHVELLDNVYGRSDWRSVRDRMAIVGHRVGERIPPSEPVERTVISGREGVIGLRGQVSEHDRERVLSTLDDLGASHLRDRPWRALSQGERLRILIARALFSEPELLILDEPCAGLDPVARAKLLDRIDGIASEPSQPPVLHVTHHIEEITKSITHVAGLAHGTMLFAGPTREVLTDDLLTQLYGHPVYVSTDGSRRRLHVQ